MNRNRSQAMAPIQKEDMIIGKSWLALTNLHNIRVFSPRKHININKIIRYKKYLWVGRVKIQIHQAHLRNPISNSWWSIKDFYHFKPKFEVSLIFCNSLILCEILLQEQQSNFLKPQAKFAHAYVSTTVLHLHTY